MPVKSVSLKPKPYSNPVIVYFNGINSVINCLTFKTFNVILNCQNELQLMANGIKRYTRKDRVTVHPVKTKTVLLGCD